MTLRPFTQSAIWCACLLALALLLNLARPAFGAELLTLRWTNNLLTVSAPGIPGGPLEIWYPEAFCRSGSAQREWGKTVLPHHTKLVSATPHTLRLHTKIDPDVELWHDLQASTDAVSLRFVFTNRGTEAVNLAWFEPACIRVARFTGRDQANYTARSFIFTTRGLTPLDQTRRQAAALYQGGQVYGPAGIPPADLNPRPLCLDQPVNGLIGCFSNDGKFLLATASDHTQELFEGVYVCLHSDPRVGGLAPGEAKRIHSEIYVLPNDPAGLLRRYHQDFPP